jgi:hypothetical protein
VVCTIGGKRMHLWRAVDDEDEALDVVVQKRRHHHAALTLLKRLLRSQLVQPQAIVTDGLASYGSALRELGLERLHRPGRLRENNRAENLHLPIRRRERKMQLFKSQASAQYFFATHAGVYNTFYTQRHLISRPTLRRFRADADAAWPAATARDEEGRLNSEGCHNDRRNGGYHWHRGGPDRSGSRSQSTRPQGLIGGSGGTYFANCSEARAAGAAPLHRGEAGYRAAMDRDGDGIACER